jgi:hypothetical protein
MNSSDLSSVQMSILYAMLRGFGADLACSGGTLSDSAMSQLVERIEYILTSMQPRYRYMEIRHELRRWARVNPWTVIPKTDPKLTPKWRKYCQSWVDLGNGNKQTTATHSLSLKACGAWTRVIMVSVFAA